MVVMRAFVGLYATLPVSYQARLTYCRMITSGTFIQIGIYGGRVSIIVHALYCYWKIVHPVHQRKYYRRWMQRLDASIVQGRLGIFPPKCPPLSRWVTWTLSNTRLLVVTRALCSKRHFDRVICLCMAYVCDRWADHAA